MEIREEVSRLVCNKLGSREGVIDGRVAEAVGSVENDAGLEKLREVLVAPTMIEPWYKNWGMLVLCLALLFIGGWFYGSVTFDSKVSNTTGIKLFDKLSGVRIKGSTFKFTDEEKWFLSDEVFHPIKGPIPEVIAKENINLKQHAAEYVFQYQRLYNKFPDDLLEIGKKIDPENPWYHYMRASELAKLSISAKMKAEGSRKTERSYEKERRLARANGVDEPAFVIDQNYNDRLAEARELIEAADKMGKLKSHRFDLAVKTLAILSDREEHDYLSRLNVIAEGASYSNESMKYLELVRVFDEIFRELSENKSKDEISKWLGIYKRFLNATLNDTETMTDVLVVNSMLKANTEAEKAAEAVGLIVEVEKIKKLNDQFASDVLKRSALHYERVDPNISEEYGILSQLMTGPNRFSLKQIEYDPNSHLPERYSDHSLLTKILAAAYANLLFILLIFVSFYLLYKGKLARFFGGRVLGMLNVKDWTALIFGGVIGPIVFYYVINQHTPLGVRKWNVLAADGMALLGQFTSMILLMIIASYCLLRWRLSVRSCGLVRRTDWWSWSALASCLVALLLIGCNGYEMSWMVYMTFGLLIYTLGFMLVRGTRGMISNERLVSVSGINRGMIMLLMLITICTAMLAPFYYADEKKWIREDKLFTLNPMHLGDNSRSYQILQATREEVRERLDMIR